MNPPPGVATAPNLFQFDSFDDDLGQWMTGAINRVDDCILGRTTYEEWVGYWPNMTSGEDTMFAEFTNSAPKHVASRSLSPEDITWSNSTLVTGDLVDYVKALREGPGEDIAVQAGLAVRCQPAA